MPPAPFYVGGKNVCVIGASRGIGLEVREKKRKRDERERQGRAFVASLSPFSSPSLP